MKNPWTHDEIPDQPASSGTGMRLLSLIVWGFLLIAAVGFLFFASRGMVDTDSVSSLVAALSVLFVVAIAIPLLKRLLAISRLLAALAFFVNLWLAFRVLAFQEVQWAQTALDGKPVDALFDLGTETVDLFSIVSIQI